MKKKKTFREAIEDYSRDIQKRYEVEHTYSLCFEEGTEAYNIAKELMEKDIQIMKQLQCFTELLIQYEEASDQEYKRLENYFIA